MNSAFTGVFPCVYAETDWISADSVEKETSIWLGMLTVHLLGLGVRQSMLLYNERDLVVCLGIQHIGQCRSILVEGWVAYGWDYH